MGIAELLCQKCWATMKRTESDENQMGEPTYQYKCPNECSVVIVTITGAGKNRTMTGYGASSIPFISRAADVVEMLWSAGPDADIAINPEDHTLNFWDETSHGTVLLPQLKIQED